MKNLKSLFFAVMTAALILSACAPAQAPSSAAPVPPAQVTPVSAGDKAMTFCITSENDAHNHSLMADIVQPWFEKQGWTAPYTVQGTVDWMNSLRTGKPTDKNGNACDVIWTANKQLLAIGDTHHILLDNPNAIAYTPLVIAGPKAELDSLGWTGKPITLDEFETALGSGKKAWSSNPMRSNSSFMFLTAATTRYAGNDSSTPLTTAQVNDPAVMAKDHKLFDAIEHSASSTGYVTTNCAVSPVCNFMITYESQVITANLDNPGNPLALTYLSDAFIYSDATPQFVNNGFADTASKQAMFTSFMKYMTNADGSSPEVIKMLMDHGVRPAKGGLRLDGTDASVIADFNPLWGVLPTIKIQPVALPESAVLDQLITNYQTLVRSAYDVVFCIDKSGSMNDPAAGSDESKWQQVVDGLSALANKDSAMANQLQLNPNDVTTLITFSSDLNVYPTVIGNDYASLSNIVDQIKNNGAGGSTDIYGCVTKGVQIFSDNKDKDAASGRQRLLILMTDGQQTVDGNLDSYFSVRQGLAPMKIFSIGIGPASDVDMSQLHTVADKANGESDSILGYVVRVDKKFTPSVWNEMPATGSVVDAMKQAVGSK